MLQGATVRCPSFISPMARKDVDALIRYALYALPKRLADLGAWSV